jgi:aconitate hydratase
VPTLLPPASLVTAGGSVALVPLASMAELGLDLPDGLPVVTRILAEMQLRRAGTDPGQAEDVVRSLRALLAGNGEELSFLPTRVLCQDHSGLPVLADLAAMRSALARAGADPAAVQPALPVDLVVDHSVEALAFGSPLAAGQNLRAEYARNGERYAFLRWAQQAFRGLRVVPPGRGIVHQVHLEHLAEVVGVGPGPTGPLARPDTVVGTDSHTPMINGLSVLGWGVGGIEATAAILGDAVPILAPAVVGIRLVGERRPGIGATEIALSLTEQLRHRDVVGRLLEFHGPGVGQLAVHDRATLSNMCPEYGATAALFPVDDRTLEYLRLTRGDRGRVDLVERYAKEQGLFRTAAAPRYPEVIDFDLTAVEPCVAGPRRPQDRIRLPDVPASMAAVVPAGPRPPRRPGRVGDGDVVIAAITSCTNTSNATAMVTAGLLARAAVRRGLAPRPWVKTTLAPGSRVVTRYLDRAGLLADLAAVGFDVVGYGCTTCIGNSGPLIGEVAGAVDEDGLAVAAVLSGNRNFEGRIHPAVRAAYLASPALVVAYALAGTVRTDLSADPVGVDPDGTPVLLADLWPDPAEVDAAATAAIGADLFAQEYADSTDGGPEWDRLPAPAGLLFDWDEASEYLVEPPFAAGRGAAAPPPAGDVVGARVLLSLGDGVTTDHISPAGPIPVDSPAGRYLIGRGVAAAELSGYGARRGNHEVLVRGTFSNPRLRNALCPDRPGGWTVVLPGGQLAPVAQAAAGYRAAGVPMIVLGGRDYGMGSSRDWAAKGPRLLGVRAVLAESFERIHRSNLVGCGILPLQFRPGENRDTLGLTGRETYDIAGVSALEPDSTAWVTARDGTASTTFATRLRIDSTAEQRWVRHGGILPAALAALATAAGGDRA